MLQNLYIIDGSINLVKQNMNIEIDIESETPIFTQLIGQVKQGVINQQLMPGDSIPSIRRLAKDLGINPNTVSKAYKLLERDNIIVGKGYRGTFIHDEAKAFCEVNLPQLAHDVMDEAVSSLRNAGLTDSEIRIAFAELMKG